MVTVLDAICSVVRGGPLGQSMGYLVGQELGGPLADPPTRAVLLMALLAFVVLGLGLVVGVVLGGRWARRGGRSDLRKPLSLRGKRPAIGVRYDDPPRGKTPPASQPAEDGTLADHADDETLPG